ncbi:MULTISPECIES: NVEALA domain-containing protein [Bacteroides]|uniref:NVEALA domain-containing protein n=1 Tax=Bacteroides TaxID=816 RepID=UPI000E432B18|nr:MULTISPECIES: NVEALA domain-containing protein [Bacteroides]RGM48949.1 hypothetical protein DXC10_04945 [Bacteroides sp. OM08-11]
MKKNVKLAFVAAFAAIAGYGVYTSQKSDSVSDLLLANVEALANDTESSDGYKYVFPGSDPSVKCVCSGSGSKSCC